MKRRSFLARVFGLAAASAVAPSTSVVLNLSDFTVTLTPIRYNSFNLELGEWLQWFESNESVVKGGILSGGLDLSKNPPPLLTEAGSE